MELRGLLGGGNAITKLGDGVLVLSNQAEINLPTPPSRNSMGTASMTVQAGTLRLDYGTNINSKLSDSAGPSARRRQARWGHRPEWDCWEWRSPRRNRVQHHAQCRRQPDHPVERRRRPAHERHHAQRGHDHQFRRRQYCEHGHGQSGGHPGCMGHREQLELGPKEHVLGCEPDLPREYRSQHRGRQVDPGPPSPPTPPTTLRTIGCLAAPPGTWMSPGTIPRPMAWQTPFASIRPTWTRK